MDRRLCDYWWWWKSSVSRHVAVHSVVLGLLLCVVAVHPVVLPLALSPWVHQLADLILEPIRARVLTLVDGGHLRDEQTVVCCFGWPLLLDHSLRLALSLVIINQIIDTLLDAVVVAETIRLIPIILIPLNLSHHGGFFGIAVGHNNLLPIIILEVLELVVNLWLLLECWGWGLVLFGWFLPFPVHDDVAHFYLDGGEVVPVDGEETVEIWHVEQLAIQD